MPSWYVRDVMNHPYIDFIVCVCVCVCVGGGGGGGGLNEG